MATTMLDPAHARTTTFLNFLRRHGRVRPISSAITDRPGDAMPLEMLQHMPLRSSYLCPDCDEVGNSAAQCPACASPNVISLAGIVNGTNRLNATREWKGIYAV